MHVLALDRFQTAKDNRLTLRLSGYLVHRMREQIIRVRLLIMMIAQSEIDILEPQCFF